MGEHAPQERTSEHDEMPARPSGTTPTAPAPGAIDLETVLSAGKTAQAGQANQADLVSTKGREGARRSALSDSVTERAV